MSTLKSQLVVLDLEKTGLFLVSLFLNSEAFKLDIILFQIWIISLLRNWISE